ncbi:MAG: type II toxin-antitoxin system VapC family toxin [Candidatus Latescibacteria bacterium]|nr:type II toxin-antitoxin system VapC family toxin [Candidatus Latescibacterota bacterium]
MDRIVVVDNSIIMSWCFTDETNEYAETVLDKLSEYTALVPSIWPLEVVNVLLVAERRKRIKQTDSIRFINLLAQLPIIAEHDCPDKRMMELLTLGRINNLSSYDASYLDLAIRKNCPIATLDKKMTEAAKKIDVTIFNSDV